MRTKLVKRYWCDFCNRAGLSAGHMRTHEKHCGLNPNRECRVCKMVVGDRDADFVTPPFLNLLDLLPDPEPFKRKYDGTQVEYFDESLSDAANAAIPALRKAAGNCPACILAAIRQKGIPAPMVTKFSFKDDMQEIWNSINLSHSHYE